MLLLLVVPALLATGTAAPAEGLQRLPAAAAAMTPPLGFSSWNGFGMNFVSGTHTRALQLLSLSCAEIAAGNPRFEAVLLLPCGAFSIATHTHTHTHTH